MVIALLLKIECRLKICKSRTSGFINASGGEREAKKSFHMHDSGWRIWLHWTPGVAIIHGPCNKIKINFYNNCIKYWSCLCSDVFFRRAIQIVLHFLSFICIEHIWLDLMYEYTEDSAKSHFLHWLTFLWKARHEKQIRNRVFLAHRHLYWQLHCFGYITHTSRWHCSFLPLYWALYDMAFVNQCNGI